jgi:hypothetical protein
MSLPKERLSKLYRQLLFSTSKSHSDSFPQQEPATNLQTKNGFTWIQWIGYHNICTYYGHPSSIEAISSDLIDRVALGFADGLPNVMLIPDPSNGEYRPLFQLEDVVNKTGKSYIFSERTFPRVNFKGKFRDLGGWTTSDQYVNCNTLYQYIGSLPILSRDDIKYLHSLKLNVLYTLDDINIHYVEWARKTLNFVIPDPVTSFSNSSSSFFISELAIDDDCCEAYGILLREMSIDIDAREDMDAKGVMFGCAGASSIKSKAKVVWCVALVYMCIGMTEKDIIQQYIMTTRSLRDYGGSDVHRSVKQLKHGLNKVKEKFGDYDNYLNTMLHVRIDHEKKLFQQQLLLPMRPFHERDDTTRHHPT